MVSSPLLTVLIPAYNEEDGLSAAVDALQGKLEELDIDAELLIIDDGSTDRTGEIADALADHHPHVRVVHHPTNRNIGGGMQTGIQEAGGEWLILIPADLPLNLDELATYMEASQNADIVVGISSNRLDYTFFRRLVHWTNIRLIQVLFNIPLRQFNYISMYRLEVLRQLEIRSWQSAFFFAEILIRARNLGFRLVEVDATYQPRKTGQPTGANLRLILRTAWDMLRFWSRP